MSRLYPMMQIAIVLLWLGLLSTCSTQPSEAAFTATSHNIRFEIRPDASSFLAVDTVRIQYRKNTQQLYFRLHQDMSLHHIMVGNMQLAWKKEIDLNSRTRLNQDIDNKLSDEKNQFYSINIPPYLQPDAIEICYSGAWPDALTQWPGYKEFEQGAQTFSSDDWLVMQEETWFPQMPHENLEMKVNFITQTMNFQHL